MTAATKQGGGAKDLTDADLVKGVRAGSAYLAFEWCCRKHPASMQDAVKAIELPRGVGQRARAFDALSDGYAVYRDGEQRGFLG
jgi:hypothetical protein